MNSGLRRRLSWPLIALGVLLALALTASSAQAADGYEPNDSPKKAFGPIKGGQRYTGSFDTRNDEDWFSFYLKRPTQLTVQVTSLAPKSCPLDEFFFSLHRFNRGPVFIDDQIAYGRNRVWKLPRTLKAGRYLVKLISHPHNCIGLRYRLQIFGLGAVTDSLKCGEPVRKRVLAKQDRKALKRKIKRAHFKKRKKTLRRVLKRVNKNIKRLNKRVKRHC